MKVSRITSVFAAVLAIFTFVLSSAVFAPAAKAITRFAPQSGNPEITKIVSPSITRNNTNQCAPNCDSPIQSPSITRAKR